MTLGDQLEFIARFGRQLVTRPKPPRRIVGLGCVLGFTLCGCNPGPLPAENPKTKPDKRAELAPVIFKSSSHPAEDTPDTSDSSSAPTPIVYSEGLNAPEGALYDPSRDRYLVSNINGSPPAKDNNGFISLLTPEGAIEKLKFIAAGTNNVTLNGPKGMGIKDTQLLVADIDTVRVFDLASGAPKASIAIPNATFLNDVAVNASGEVWVTDSGVAFDDKGRHDTGTAAIYKLTTKTNGNWVVEKVLSAANPPSADKVGNPNGVAAWGKLWLIASFGNNWLHAVDGNGKIEQAVQLPKGGLDGIIVLSPNDILVSSWEAQAVYRGNFKDGFRSIAEGLVSPADIGFDPKRQRVIVPHLMQNKVTSLPLPDASSVASTTSPTSAAPNAPAPSTEASPERKPSRSVAASHAPQ